MDVSFKHFAGMFLKVPLFYLRLKFLLKISVILIILKLKLEDELTLFLIAMILE